jgi:uncharacterized membrane protein YbhN (UPF0104 family)
MVVGFDGAEVWARIRSANGPLVVTAVLGLTAVHAVGAFCWAMLCRRLGGLRLGWSTALRVHYAAQALGGITPANIGGDAYRVVAARGAGPGWGAAVAPVLVQRATSYLALAILALPAIAFLSTELRSSDPILLPALLLCGLAGAVAIVMLAAPGSLARLLPRVPWVRPPLRSVAMATALGLTFHAMSVLLTALLLAAVDPSTVGAPVVAAIVVARLSLAIPILPSGLGANEAILALLFASLGMAPQVALAGLLLGRMALVLTTLIGAGLLLFGRQGIPGGTAAAQEARQGAPVISR